MNQHIHRWRIGALAAAVAVAQFTGSVLAQDDKPKVTTAGDARYVSGGVGIDEEQFMHSIAKDYNLKMAFRMQGTGQYYADVKVKVTDAAGKKVLFDTVANGPCLFASLPPGKYMVTAENKGVARTKQVVLASRTKGTAFDLFWPAEKDETPTEKVPPKAAGGEKPQWHTCW
jgi:hypothetical protein